MRAIESHPVRFGELAGPLVHGAVFFDWQLDATQELVAAVDHPFEEIVAAGGVPYAPVVVSTTVYRYPTFDDVVDLEVTPLSVGEASLELCYEITADGEPISTARMTHVTVDADGESTPLPADSRAALETRRVDRDPEVGPTPPTADGEAYPTITDSFPVRSPHAEGVEWAYFEEYPRFAGIALERFLEAQGSTLAELSGEKRPFRLRDWRWEFHSPVPLESTLGLECDVRAVDRETVRIVHTLTSDGAVAIEGVSEYGCFDRSGRPVAFEPAMLEPLEG